MRKINIFLSSSIELKETRRQFEIEIYRKSKAWMGKGIVIYLDICEDISAGLTPGGTQETYNSHIRESDIFVLVANAKIGKYTLQEFNQALESYRTNRKPIIFIYLQEHDGEPENSLAAFKTLLQELNHFHGSFSGFHDLWNQFNKELDRIENNPLIGKEETEQKLPDDLINNLITDKNRWVNSLAREFNKQGLPVRQDAWAIFQHYGWLIETFLQKMETATGRENTLRRLSFMAEAFGSSVRYLCFIQIAQLFQSEKIPENEMLQQFLTLDENHYSGFDFTDLLVNVSRLFHHNPGFVPEICQLVTDITNNRSDLYHTVLYLDEKRKLLLCGALQEDESLGRLLDEYLTALAHWLRRLAFLANYRMVSVKEINLNYKLGTARNFVHLYGELHGIYNESRTDQADYMEQTIENVFTYSQSVLLFRGSSVPASFRQINDPETYLSLSPLVIDQSVFAEKNTQTPEIFYFTGYSQKDRQYRFAQYKNELAYPGRELITSNKWLNVRMQNNRQPLLDDLFEHLETLFRPFKSTHP